MKKWLLFFIIVTSASPLFAQKVDSIYFHLYTDSLKKGQHNYINVDAKMSNGNWMPMTAKDITFSCPTAVFDGNQLIIPFEFKGEKVTVKAVLKSNPAIWLERTIWIKTVPDGDLPTKEEILKSVPAPKTRKRNR